MASVFVGGGSGALLLFHHLILDRVLAMHLFLISVLFLLCVFAAPTMPGYDSLMLQVNVGLPELWDHQRTYAAFVASSPLVCCSLAMLIAYRPVV